MFGAALLVLQLVTNSTSPAGTWAGTWLAPGSLAAMRLIITEQGGISEARLILNTYGEETTHEVENFKINADGVSFITQISQLEVRFNGTVTPDSLRGTFEVSTDGKLGKGEWQLRRIRPTLLKSTGRFAVAERHFYWTDETRLQTITDDEKDNRIVFVQLWSPTKATAALPLIIFSPGLGNSTAKYTTIVENLASHGFVVAAINHAYDAGDFTIPDGPTIRYANEKWNRPVSQPWTPEERRSFFDERRRGWAGDVSFVISELIKMSNDPSFAIRLDTNRIGALGHSFGGQAASLACAEDHRIKACVNLDGLTQGAAFLPDANGENLKQPFAFFTTGRVANDYELRIMGLSRKENDSYERRRMLDYWKPALKTRLQALDLGTYLVVVRGATHHSFSDAPLLEATPKDESVGERQHRAGVINKYIVAFFDRFLKGGKTSLFEPRDESHPEVVVELVRK
jgi:dienelactone hydrolase